MQNESSTPIELFMLVKSVNRLKPFEPIPFSKKTWLASRHSTIRHKQKTPNRQEPVTGRPYQVSVRSVTAMHKVNHKTRQLRLHITCERT